MAIKIVLESLDEVPEALREFYKQQKIKIGTEEKDYYVFDAEGIDMHPNVLNLKSAFEKQKADAKTAKTELAEMKKKVDAIPDDFDAEEWAKFKSGELIDIKDPEQKKKFDEQVVQARKNLEAQIDRLKADKTQAVAEKENEIKRLEGVIENLLVSENLSKALDEAGVNPDLKDGATALLRSQIKVVNDDGDYKAIVETDMGQVDVAKHVADWMTSDKGRKYVKPAAGGGAGGGDGKHLNGENPWAEGHVNLTKQQELIKTNAPRARALAQAAGVKNINW